MRGGSSASHPSMGDENPSLEIPMKNWSLKTPCLLLTGATPIKKTEKLSICEKNKTSNPKNQKNKNKKEKQHIPNKSNKSKTLQKTTPNKCQNTKKSKKQYRKMITNYMFEMKLNYSELKWMKRNVPRVSLWGMSPSIDKNGNPKLVYHGLIRGYVANIIRYHDWPHNSCTNPVNSTKPWFRFGEK